MRGLLAECFYPSCVMRYRFVAFMPRLAYNTHPFFHNSMFYSGVVIEVVDNGPGIDQDDLPHIFDRGFRGRQPRESSIPGTGLGLGIAREIMRSMGGDVKVENKINQDKGHWGAGVKLFLPRRAREGE